MITRPLYGLPRAIMDTPDAVDLRVAGRAGVRALSISAEARALDREMEGTVAAVPLRMLCAGEQHVVHGPQQTMDPST